MPLSKFMQPYNTRRVRRTRTIIARELVRGLRVLNVAFSCLIHSYERPKVLNADSRQKIKLILKISIFLINASYLNFITSE